MIRALVVDDEPPSREKLLLLLAREGDVEVVGEARDGKEAVEQIVALNPDVVFLDIRMPVRDGFAVVREVGVENMPMVVFVTAHDEYALEAFDVHAVDYLLKPFAAKRLYATLDRVRDELGAQQRASDIGTRLENLLQAMAKGADERGEHPRYLQRIRVERSPHREVLLALADVHLVRARRNHVELFTQTGSYTRRMTLTQLEERLDPEMFLRINRAEIVRLDAIKEMQAWFHGDYRVLLETGQRLVFSRRYRAKTASRFDVR